MLPVSQFMVLARSILLPAFHDICASLCNYHREGCIRNSFGPLCDPLQL